MIDCLFVYFCVFLPVRGIINGKAGKAVALPKFSDTITLSQPGGGADCAHSLALPHLNFFCDQAPD